MRLALAWAACPTFLLGDFDDVAKQGRHGQEFAVAVDENRARVESLLKDFVCEGLSQPDCEAVPQSWSVPVPQSTPSRPPWSALGDDPSWAAHVTWSAPSAAPPRALPSRTYTYDTAGTDRFWKQYLKQTYLAHAAQTAFEHLEQGCMSQKCTAQLKACHGAQPCNRRLLRMETNETDNGIDAVYGTEGPPPYNRSTPLSWAELSDEEHGVFSCALAACAEPRLAVVDAVAEGFGERDTQKFFVKRLFDEDREVLLKRYTSVAELGCHGLLPIVDTNAKFKANGTVYNDAVVMPNMDGTARGWAKRHTLEERQECAPALIQAVTMGLGCLHDHGFVHNDLLDVNVLYTATDPVVLLEDAAQLRRSGP